MAMETTESLSTTACRSCITRLDAEGYQSAVTKVVGHHNGGIQRCEIQRSNWLVIIPSFGIQHLSKQNMVN